MSFQKVGGITQERRQRAFQEALTYQQFVSRAEVNVERLQINYELYKLKERDLAYFTGLSEPIDVLVLAHDWCGDVVANLPLFGKIERETGGLKLHILLRDPDNQDIGETYLHTDGTNHIPTYVFFNKTGEELGVFIERPDSITELSKEWRENFWDQHPQWEGRGKFPSELDEQVRKALFSFIKEQRPQAVEQEQQAIIDIIRSIISQF
ncbi:thioredoxin family protein [Paenibacillus sp. SYP-B3998]|uniref:Thioredoxin family protein n=1 Tax=Paenibacillus sp. SYP-B3998 TaxID=2678564 RepID=A0A6G4A3Z8_9BACL|nr:thioredoxin family protein [Paenibacillus sp. SYP-B3998]NEW08539.1 thioredoxin family protein [Paenibacillus sp. SYP-B3998]